MPERMCSRCNGNKHGYPRQSDVTII